MRKVICIALGCAVLSGAALAAGKDVAAANAQRPAAERIVTALDNTWGAGLAFNGFDLGRGARFTPGSGADIVVQALTKYPSGGGDVLMGSVVTRDEALHLKLKFTHMRMGWGIGANDAEAILRANELSRLAPRLLVSLRGSKELNLVAATVIRATIAGRGDRVVVFMTPAQRDEVQAWAPGAGGARQPLGDQHHRLTYGELLGFVLHQPADEPLGDVFHIG